MNYEVRFTPQARNDILKLDRSVAQRLIKKIEWLANNILVIAPQPLKGRFSGIYKLTVGDWRILYDLDHNTKTLTIHVIGHRREIYKVR